MRGREGGSADCRSLLFISLTPTRTLWKSEKNLQRTDFFLWSRARQTLACKLISVQTEVTTLDRPIMGGRDSSLKKHGKLSVYREGNDFGSWILLPYLCFVGTFGHLESSLKCVIISDGGRFRANTGDSLWQFPTSYLVRCRTIMCQWCGIKSQIGELKNC